jgi:putative urate catabolism protein
MTSPSTSSEAYPRDLVGYGRTPPDPHWPGKARVAVSFVLNYEEGGEHSVLHGDSEAETFLSEIIGAQPVKGLRHWNMESFYDFGARAGVWRILNEFDKRKLPLTVYGVGMALERHADLARSFIELGHEVASHGWRWFDYQYTAESAELADMLRAIAVTEEICGVRPQGYYLGRCSPNTVRIAAEHGNFRYCSDVYDDDLPYWNTQYDKPLLMIPYPLDANDMRFASPQGFNTGDHFFHYLRDAFDVLYAEGESAPKMMSIGLHCRLIGRPGRFRGLQKFLDHIQAHANVWVTRRIDIAEHWHKHFPLA